MLYIWKGALTKPQNNASENPLWVLFVRGYHNEVVESWDIDGTDFWSETLVGTQPFCNVWVMKEYWLTPKGSLGPLGIKWEPIVNDFRKYPGYGSLNCL